MLNFDVNRFWLWRFVLIAEESEGKVYWFLHKYSSCVVPTGLRHQFVESIFPTLKRGANQLCASGAFTVLNKARAYGALVRRLLVSPQ